MPDQELPLGRRADELDVAARQAKFTEQAMEHMPSLYSAALRMTRSPSDA